MNIRQILFAAVLCIVLPLQGLSSLDVLLHDRRIPVDQQVLREKGFDAPEGRAAVLGDLLPLMLDVSNITVVTSDGKNIVLSGRITADDLFSIYVHPGGVHAGEQVIDNPKEIKISGRSLPVRPLEIWVSWEGTDELKAALQQFSLQYDISVTVLEVPGISRKLVSYERSKQPMPDVVMVQSDHIPQYLAEKVLQPASHGAFSGDGAFTLSGTQWAVPFYLDSQLIIYNPSLIDIKTPGMTLDEFEASLGEVKNQGKVVPASWNIYSAYWLVPFIYGFGGDSLIEESGGVRLDTPEVKEALEYLLYLKKKGLVDPMERDGMLTSFLQGRSAVMLTGSYMVPHLEQLGVDFRTAAFPHAGAAGNEILPLLDYKGLAVPRRARNPAAARRLISYLSSPRIQRYLPASMGKLPADVRAVEYAAQLLPYGDTLTASMERGIVIPPEPAYSVFKDVMWSMLRFMISERIGIDEGLNRSQQMIDLRLREFDQQLGGY